MNYLGKWVKLNKWNRFYRVVDQIDNAVWLEYNGSIVSYPKRFDWIVKEEEIVEEKRNPSKNQCLAVAHGYFYMPVHTNELGNECYDKDQQVFYWLLKAESGL